MEVLLCLLCFTCVACICVALRLVVDIFMLGFWGLCLLVGWLAGCCREVAWLLSSFIGCLVWSDLFMLICVYDTFVGCYDLRCWILALCM